MALVIKDRVKEQTTTTGTGSVTLGGAVSGFETFSAVGDGNTTYYAIVHQTADEWEVGLGTYTAAGTLLSRDTILESTNSDAAVNFSAGTKDVFVTYPSDKAVYYDAANNVGIGTSSPDAAAKLDVNGQVLVRNTGAAPDTTPGGQYGFYIQPDSTGTVNLMSYSSGGSTDIQFFTNSGGAAAVEAARFTSSGDFEMAATYGPALRNVSPSSTIPSILVGKTDTDTGLGSPTGDNLSLITGGSERVRIDSSGNVGIGTSAPTVKFQVVADFGVVPTNSANYYPQIGGGVDGGADAYLALSGGTSNNGNLNIKARGTYGQVRIFTGGSAGSVSSNESMRVTETGNVGIGTSSVATNLHVYENTANGTINNIALLDAGNQNPSVSGSGVSLDFRSNSGTTYFGGVGGYSDGTNYVAGLWGGAAASGAPDLAVTSSGNVGIGTSAPAQKLSIESTGGGSSEIDISLVSGISNKECILNFGKNLATADRYLGRIFYQVDNNVMGFWTNNTERMRIDSSGRVLIGTTTAPGGQKMAVVGGGVQFSGGTSAQEGLRIQRASGYASITGINNDNNAFNAISFFTSGTAALHIATGNNVGIGTSSPTRKLSVNGSIQIASGAVIEVGTTSLNTYIAGIEGASGRWAFATNGSERMRIDSSGKLSVNGTTGMGRLNAYASNWPENALAIYSANVAGQTNYAGIAFNNQDTDAAVGNVADIYTNPAGTLSLTSGANPAIQLKYGSGGISGGTPALTVDSSGRIGIGTTSPSYLTHLYSTSVEPKLVIEDASFGAGRGGMVTGSWGGNGIRLDSLGAAGWVYVGGSNTSYIPFTIGTEKARFHNNGNFGLGTTAPAKQLEITKSARATITSLTDGATITPDFDAAQNFAVTLGGNRTLANPSNIDPGQTGSIFVVQDVTGGRTLSFGSYWKFAGGTAPTLSTGTSATDRIDYVVQTSTAIHAVASLNLS
jgi:hypothetical protein